MSGAEWLELQFPLQPSGVDAGTTFDFRLLTFSSKIRSHMFRVNRTLLLNLVCLVLGLLLLANFTLAQINERIEQTVTQYQTYINQARQSESLLDQLAKRVAKGSDSEPALRAVLKRRQLNVTLEVNGETKHYP